MQLSGVEMRGLGEGKLGAITLTGDELIPGRTKRHGQVSLLLEVEEQLGNEQNSD